MPGDFLDLYVLGIIAGGIAAMAFIGSRGYRNHSVVMERLLEPLLSVSIVPCIIAFTALFCGDPLDAAACFVMVIAVGMLWLMVVMAWLVFVV